MQQHLTSAYLCNQNAYFPYHFDFESLITPQWHDLSFVTMTAASCWGSVK